MSGPALKILVADDEPDVLAITARKIRDAGFMVVTAADGQEALELFRAEAPDILVLDVNMPRRDGLEVLACVKAESALTRWVPVIVVSAQGELEDMRRGFDLKADHYLTKPCRAEDVVHAVRLMATLIPLRSSA
jgi:DNA-binding response OmpR family regulator